MKKGSYYLYCQFIGSGRAVSCDRHGFVTGRYTEWERQSLSERWKRKEKKAGGLK